MKKIIYLLLSILGVIVPYSYLLPFAIEEGLNYKLFLDQMLQTPIASFFSVNVLIAALILLIFVVLENIREPIKFSWMVLVGTCLAGVSFGLPFFLFIRELSFKNKRGNLLTYQVNYNKY